MYGSRLLQLVQKPNVYTTFAKGVPWLEGLLALAEGRSPAALALLWLCPGFALALQWLCGGSAFALLWLCAGFALALLWLCSGFALALLWEGTREVWRVQGITKVSHNIKENKYIDTNAHGCKHAFCWLQVATDKQLSLEACTECGDKMHTMALLRG